MLLLAVIAVFNSPNLAPPAREAAVIEACSAWKTGLGAGAPPQTHSVGSDGLCFYGEITTESSAAFVEAVSELDPTKPLVVVLTSVGGEVNAGMAMGEALIPRATTVVALSACLSSCANYPFVAGDRRVIGSGALLGYHGGIPDAPEQEWIDLRERFSQTMSGDELERSVKSSRDAYEVQVARQDAFLKSAAVDTNLFRWMRAFSHLPEAERLALCPVQDAAMYVISDALLAEHGVIIDQNNGPRNDADLAAELAKRGSPGLGCYWD